MILVQFALSIAKPFPGPADEVLVCKLYDTITLSHILQLLFVLVFNLFCIGSCVHNYDFLIGNKERRHSNIHLPITFFCLFLFLNISGAYFGKVILKSERARIESGLARSKESLEKLINQRILFATTSSNLISSSPVIADYLLDQSELNRESLNRYFRAFSRNYPDGICYLINTDGLVIAASDKQDLFVGRYLNFRNYFQEAISGKNGRLIDYGKFTNELGFYSAHPVYKVEGGEIIGVCVVKRNLDDLKQYFELYHPSLLLDRNGKVFIASEADFVGKEVYFQDFEQEVGNSDRLSERADRLMISRNSFFYTFIDLKLGGWKILLLTSSKDILRTQIVFLLAMTGLSLFFILFFVNTYKRTEMLVSFEQIQDQFNSVLYNVDEGIMIVSAASLKILLANNGFMRLFGLTSNPAGRNFFELIPAVKVNFAKTSHDLVRGTFSHEREFLKADKSVFAAEVNGTSIYYNGEKAIIFFIRDISKRKKYEAELTMAKEAAERASIVKSRFLANSSHEIRTPMTAILGLNELAKKYCSSDEQKKLMDLASDSARALLDLLNDILDLSQIEAGKLKVVNQAFNLRKMVLQLIDLMKLKADEKKLSTVLEFGEDVPEYVVSDPHRIRQVLTNLLSNSIKFTHRGEVKLKVDCEQTGPKDLNLKFAVCDTGEGIPESLKQDIFNAFVYSMPDKNNSARGPGLGLAICRQIADLLGGSLTMESQLGSGSSFYFTVPVKKAEKNEIDSSDKENEGIEIELSNRGTPLKILVADDNDTNLFLASSIISGYGGKAECARDGIEVLEMLAKGNYDLLLLDIQMPRLDGLGVLKRLRTGDGNMMKLPVIALSAFSTEEERNKAFEAGANGYLAKPYFPEDLLDIIRKVLSEKITLKAKQAKSEPVTSSEGCLEEGGTRQINVRELEFRILNKPENVLQIKDIFARRSSALIEALTECIKSEDSEKLREAAHSIKGLAGMLAANKAFQKAFEIEQLARNNQIEQALEGIPQLVAMINEISADLEVICKGIRKE
ncbi:MAG: hypothetical protein Kow0029_24770 [Candidatus Rifleibacteriota bacterium]